MLILFIIIQALALTFFLETLRRIRRRVREFPMQEERGTLPFGIIRLRHVVMLYILLYLVWVVFSFSLYFKVINSEKSPSLIEVSPDNTIEY